MGLRHEWFGQHHSTRKRADFHRGDSLQNSPKKRTQIDKTKELCVPKKLFGIYFGGYTEDTSENFVLSFEEHSELCNEKDGTRGRK